MCTHTFSPIDAFIQDHVLYGSGTLLLSVSSLYTHTHIFHTGKMALTHLLIPQKMENNGLGTPVRALFTQQYSSLAKTFSCLCYIMFLSSIKQKHMLFVWLGGNAINLALIHFTSFCCCPGLNVLCLFDLIIQQIHIIPGAGALDTQLSEEWLLLFIFIYWTINSLSALSQEHPPGSDIHNLTPLLMTVPKWLTLNLDIVHFLKHFPPLLVVRVIVETLLNQNSLHHLIKMNR